jgi:hypothetical protein
MIKAEIKIEEAALGTQSNAAGPPGAKTGAKPAGNPNEKVVDAEFEEVAETT